MSNAPILELTNLLLTYGSGDDAEFRAGPICLKIFPGQTIALLGETGSGKSLLLHVIAGLHPFNSGSLSLDGLSPSSALLAQYQEKLAITFQHHALLDDQTALENVALGAVYRGLTDPYDRAQNMLDEMGIGASAHLYPQALSGGMKRRVGLARALVVEPQLLLADQPTAGLDPITGQKVMACISRHIHERGMSALIATHDVDQVLPHTHGTLVLGEGSVLFQGSHLTDTVPGELTDFLPMKPQQSRTAEDR